MPLPAISPTGVATPYVYPTQTAQGSGLSGAFGAAPGAINPPIIFEPGPELTGNRRQIFIIATGQAPDWGGAEVHVSIDNLTYSHSGTIASGGTQGRSTAVFAAGADPDTADTLSVDVSQSRSQIIAATAEDADDYLSLAYVAGGPSGWEIVSYSAATLTGPGNYHLGTYLRRGVYDAASIASHPAGAQFGLINGATFREEYSKRLVGKTIYFKFPSFNTLGGQLEDIATVPFYTYTLTGIGAGADCSVDLVLSAGASEDWGHLKECGSSMCDWGLLTSPSTLCVDLGPIFLTPPELPLCATPPTDGQVLEWDGSEWCPATLGGPAVCPTPPTNGQVLVFDASLGEAGQYCPADSCALVAACLTPALGVDAVVFDGSTFLWGFPAMSDSSEWSLSVWLYMSGPQLTSLGWAGNYVPDLPDGDLNRTNEAYLLYNPSNSNDTFFVSVGNTIARYGGTPGSRLVNPITNATSANPIVITFTWPHGIVNGSYVTPIFFNQTGWGSFELTSGTNSYHVTAATSNTITLDFDSTGFPAFNNSSSGPNQLALFQIYNSTNWYMSDGVVTKDFSFRTTAAMPPGAWVNLLASGNTNLAAGSKILNLYYGDMAIAPDGSAPVGSTGHEGDVASAFPIKFSEPNSGIESNTWQIGTGGGITNGGIICYMAEFWFAPGQYIDFTNPANRALFHNGSNAPVDLGATGSTPTGTAPALYLSVRSGGVATDFLTNRAGGSPLSLNSDSDPFVLAPTHP